MQIYRVCISNVTRNPARNQAEGCRHSAESSLALEGEESDSVTLLSHESSDSANPCWVGEEELEGGPAKL